MVVGDWKTLEARPMTGEGVSGVLKRVLVSPAEGWDGWVMRLFEVAPGGHTPRHTHAWPHINFVDSGEGTLHLDGVDYQLGAAGFAFVPAGAQHQFSNRGDAAFVFVCIVPEAGEY
jgi:quercetin dioxygenase-like cupin family protein